MIARIYIDESGTPALDIEKKGVLPFMVYSAVIIKEEDVEKAKALLQKIIAVH